MPSTRFGSGVFCDGVKMVSHQAIGVHLPAGFLTGFGQRFEKIVTVNVVQEDYPRDDRRGS